MPPSRSHRGGIMDRNETKWVSETSGFGGLVSTREPPCKIVQASESKERRVGPPWIMAPTETEMRGGAMKPPSALRFSNRESYSASRTPN